MPAPDYATLWDVETAVETAVKAILTAASVTPCYIQRETGKLPGSRVDIQLRVGGYERDLVFSATLIFDIFTNRTKDAAALHGIRRGKIRNLFRRTPTGGDPHSAFTSSVLPYHVVNRLAPLATDPQLQIDDDTDWSRLSFDALISTRPSALPPTSP